MHTAQNRKTYNIINHDTPDEPARIIFYCDYYYWRRLISEANSDRQWITRDDDDGVLENNDIINTTEYVWREICIITPYDFLARENLRLRYYCV